jgi:hypothetical protein
MLSLDLKSRAHRSADRHYLGEDDIEQIYQKIPRTQRVIIRDDVEIAPIPRSIAAQDATRSSARETKIDNRMQLRVYARAALSSMTLARCGLGSRLAKV